MKPIHLTNNRLRTHYIPNKHKVSLNPKLIYSGTLKCSPEWKEDDHSHTFLEIMFVRRGSGATNIGGEEYALKKGDIIIYNAGVGHRERSDKKEPLECHFFGAKNIRIDGLAPDCLIKPGATPIVEPGSDFAMFDLLFDQLIRESSNDRLYNREISDSILKSILLSVMRIVSYGNTDYEKINESYLKAKEFIDKSFAEINTVNDLCNQLYIDKYYFSHLFKECSGMPPLQYIIEKKIALAKELLSQSDLPIKDVAVKCGYTDAGYFSKVFKKLTDQPPINYRETHRRAPTHHDL